MNPRLALLVDVDKTLLLNQEGTRINDDLIAEWQQQNITHIYLFTSMSLSDIAYKIANPKVNSREDLINYLKDSGIKVVEVLTPADVEYKIGLGKAYDEIYLPQYCRFIKGELTAENYYEDKKYNEAKENYAELKNSVGKQAKACGENFTEKSLLFDYFVANMPKEIDSIQVYDDLPEHLDAILAAAKKYPALKVECYLITDGVKTLYGKKEKSIGKRLSGLFDSKKSVKAVAASASTSALALPQQSAAAAINTSNSATTLASRSTTFQGNS